MGVKNNLGEKYYIGFDIGTNSVGYAVTDENYNILKFNGKAMWGSRLFDEAETAAARRVFRSNRRRLSRRRQRIELLQELFAEEIGKVDLGFYQRIKDSAFLPEDKVISQSYSLFSDKLYNDADYYKRFPTIYHLRKELITSNEKFDIRLIYLAIHHILKHRGHFLFSGSFENTTSLTGLVMEFQTIIQEMFEIKIECKNIKELENVLPDKHISKKDKSDKVFEMFSFGEITEIEKKTLVKQLKEIIKLICGQKANLVNIFNDEQLKNFDKSSFSFADSTYVEIEENLNDVLEERMILINAAKGIYDWSVLSEILKGGEFKDKSYLSVAKVNKYSKHKDDLELLKDVIKKFSVDEYKKMFQKPEKDNYVAYIGYTKCGGIKKRIKRCSQEEFFKNLKKVLDNAGKVECISEDVDRIKKEIDSGTFLPLHVTKDNGVIPYQVHEMELEQILENAEKHYPFLVEADDAGKTVSDKIKEIFKFRIPYYVGPLNTFLGENAWMVRKEEGKIYPWNFEEKIDLDASAEIFIRRMTNKCTYMLGKDVLPKSSLLYSEFMMWNELNNVKIGLDKLTVDIKKKAVEELFKVNKKVSGKRLRDFLRSEGMEFEDSDVTGFDINFKASLTSYLDMKKIFGEDIKKYSVRCMAEQLILWITLYGDDSKMLKRIVRKEYSKEIISDKQLKEICRLKYQGWGRLSKEFLTELEGADVETGEVFSIIGALRETNDNLMQLLSFKYTFSSNMIRINEQYDEKEQKISYETTIKELVVSPAVKRAIWQVILIAEEIKKIMKSEPSKIFIEVAREKEGKSRSTSRKDRLVMLYDKIKDESRDWKKELETKTESDFRNIKLYLYYTQMGKCMYSGDDIDLSELPNANIYDRDHIYPQSKTKDDSLDNLVLVRKDINQKKDNDVLSPNIQKKMCGFWKVLKNKGLISDVKYQRLIRKTPLSDEELAGFINRQIVEVRQSTKALSDLFLRIYKNSEIVYVKAAAVSEFRKSKLKMAKVRSLNDCHHAKDAYLNIVVGNVYQEKFTKNPMKWLKDNQKEKYNLNKMFDYDIIKNEKAIWKKGKDGTIKVIRKNMLKKDMQYTRYAIENKSGQNGGFFDQNIVSKSDNPSIPVKKGMDVKKYGGYKTITPAYFALIESVGKKGEKQRSIEMVPLYLKKEIESNQAVYINYCRDKIGLVNPKIIIQRIKKDSYLIINRFPMHLRGTTGKQLKLQGAVQFFVSEDMEKYLKGIEKYIQRNIESNSKEYLKITEYDGITKERNVQIYNEFLRKMKETIYTYRPAGQYEKVKNGFNEFEERTIEEQCIILNEILHLFQCKPITADLRLIGASAKAGNIAINKFISKYEEAKIIYQSTTGLFQKEINLLTVGQEEVLRKV